MALSITILQPASLTATVQGGSILAAVVGASATLNVEMGTPGPAATIQVGTTTTGDAGTDASVVNVGTLSSAIFDFTIPRGDQGEQGERGPQGYKGDTGATGAKGDKGDTGNAATIAVFGTNTVPPDQPANVENFGTPQAASFYFSIPQGVQGEQGIKGDQGDPGVGVPVGGTAGQVLAKIDSTNYNTEWVDVSAGDYLPLTGGTLTGTLDVVDAPISISGENAYLLTPYIQFDGDSSIQTTAGLPLHATTNQTITSNGAGSGDTIFENYVAIRNYLDIQKTDGIGGRFLVSDFSSDPEEGVLSRLEITPYQIIFPDSTSQITAGLPLTGGTLSGNLDITATAGNEISLSIQGTAYNTFNFGSEYGLQLVSANGLLTFNNNGLALTGTYNGITFPDSTFQSTAFPPTGGTTSQYIDGTGALQTFPTVTTAGKMVTSVRNNSGATITKGTVVYINGAVGNKPTIAKAQANTEATSKATYGFVEANIANNADGNIVILGLLENIDTQGYADGDLLFLSPTTAGGFTKTQPFSPYHYVRVGTVIRGGHPTLGSIAVQVTNGFQLDEMSDVGATAPTNNNVLTWNSATSQWLDKSIATILGYTPANVSNYAYATTTQAITGTSTTAVINPSVLFDAKSFQGFKYATQFTWTNASSGTGSSATAQNANARLVAAPTTATGYAIASAVLANNSRGNIYNAGWDFSKRIVLGGRFARNVASPDTNSVFRYSIGKTSTTDAGDLSIKGLMIKVAGTGALQLLVHNGTTLTTTTSSFTPSNGQAYDVMITSDGAGNCALFVNGSSVATSTGGPTTIGLTNYDYLLFEVQNTATISASPYNICASDFFVNVGI